MSRPLTPAAVATMGTVHRRLADFVSEEFGVLFGVVPTLIGQNGSLEGRRFDFDRELTIGREDEELTVDDPGVSRQHATVSVSGYTVTIEDLGSLNGTFVNETRIDAATTIVHGDIVRVGSTSLLLEGGATGATVAIPARRVEAPALPFGAYAAGDVKGGSRRRVASRQLLPEIISVLAIVSTAAANDLYFTIR